MRGTREEGKLTRAVRLTFVAALTVAVSLTLAAAAAAATIEVDTTADENLDPGPETGCSLREATIAANTDAAFGGCAAGTATDTITFDPTVFPVGGLETINLATFGQLQLTSDTTIAGPGSGELEITNSIGTDRILLADEGVGDQVTISGLRITGGTQDGDGLQRGGGILNHTTLTIVDVVLAGNTVAAHGDSGGAGDTAGAEGGAIYTDADLTIDSSVIESNDADADNSDALVDTVFARGAGIFHLDGGLTVRNSRIASNSASIVETSTEIAVTDEASGGGVYAADEAVIEQTSINGNALSAESDMGAVAATGAGIRIDGGDGSRIELSTIYGNSPFADGATSTILSGAGAIVVNSPMPVVSSTLAGNGISLIDIDGANLAGEGTGQASIANTIVAEPVGLPGDAASNCAGNVVSADFNVDYDPGNPSTCDPTEPNDQTSDPLLPAAPGANGGVGLTMLPEPGSSVVDQGSAASQTVADEDQRGLARPAFFGDISNPPLGDGADIGAAEVQIGPPTFTGTTPASPNVDDTPNVRGSVAADSPATPTVRLFTNPSCTVLTGSPATPAVFASPGIVTGPLPHNATTSFYGTVQSSYGTSHCSTGAFPKTITYTQADPPQPPPPVTPAPVVTEPPPATKKKCKKGFVKKKGKCVRKKRKKAAT